MVPGDVRLIQANIVVGGSPDPQRATTHRHSAKPAVVLIDWRPGLAQPRPGASQLDQRIGGDAQRSWLNPPTVDERAVLRFEVNELDLAIGSGDSKVPPGGSLVLDRQLTIRVSADLDRIEDREAQPPDLEFPRNCRRRRIHRSEYSHAPAHYDSLDYLSARLNDRDGPLPSHNATDISMTEPLEQGDHLGDFEIVSIAGAGGMGIVYKARQQSLDRDVALKVIRDEIASESEYRKRFLREARLAASVDHPHVVSVYDVGSEDERLYLVLQWIDGVDLKRELLDSGRISPKRAVAIGTQLAGALDALHSVAGLVHRDVKPANVLLREVGGEDHAYLTDFGIAKPPDLIDNLTKTGSTIGTTGYLSPEQIQGKPAGPRSDLYALGCLVFEMMTGKQPFKGENDLAVRWAHANERRPLLSESLPALGQRYDEFFAVALAVDPAERFGSGREFAEALAASQVSDSPTGATAIISKPREETKIGPPTPLPLGARRQETPPPGYQPSYGYVTPPPPPRERSGGPLALILLAIVAVAGIAVGALAAAGVFSTHESTQSAQKVASRGRVPVKSLTPKRTKIPSDAVSCGSGLWVNTVTSCPFAENTRSAYAEANGARSIEVYSPVTGKTYGMNCDGSGTVACRGGNNATVYFTSAEATGQDAQNPAPEPEGQQSSSSPPESLQSCDQNISASSATTCPFAENVFVAYWEEYESAGEQHELYVEAFSPATSQSYGMSCTLESGIVDCYGGNEAFVTFPMHAVRVY